MQWYAAPPREARGEFDPVSASRQASEIGSASSAAGVPATPLVQIQRVFDAAHEEVLAEVRSFGAHRSGHDSPYDWRIYVKSQELFVRYCCWASIRSMLLEREQYRIAPQADEAKRWTQDGDA